MAFPDHIHQTISMNADKYSPDAPMQYQHSIHFPHRLEMEDFRHMGIYDFNLRIGIHTGPVNAGIIGTKKFSYDLWGDTVNVASQMETVGVLGEIQVTSEVYRRIKCQYLFKERGPVYVKGKGEMPVFVLIIA